MRCVVVVVVATVSILLAGCSPASTSRVADASTSPNSTSPTALVPTTSTAPYEPTDDASSEPTDDASSEPTDEPEDADPLASLSKDEKKYVKERVYSEPGDDDYADDVTSELKKGRKVCSNIGDRGEGWSRSRYIYDREDNESDAYDAVKYLCRKYDDDLKLAKQSIFFENNDVGRSGDDVRPGTYRTAPKVSDCYWSRLSKGGNIIANNFVEYASNGVTVTVQSSDDGFTTSGDCGAFYPTAKP